MSERELASTVSEDQLVGSAITKPDEAIFQISEAGLTPDWFTQREAVTAFSLSLEMYLQQQEISLPTILEYAAQKKKHLTLEYLTRCIDVTPVRDIQAVIHKVKEMWMRREMVDKAKELRNLASLLDDEPGESIGKIICDLSDLTATHKKMSLEQIKQSLMGKYRAAVKGECAGISLPWETVMKKLGGLRRGCVTVFAGPGGVGKSMCCANLALHLGRNAVPTGYLPFEDGCETTWGRIAGIEAQRSTFGLEQGKASMAEVNAHEHYIDAVMKYPIHMEQRRMTVQEIMAWAIHQKAKSKIEVLIIDAWKDIKRPGRDTKHEDELSQGLCEIAERLNIAVWVDHHVRKSDGSSEKRKLTTDDVRGSGQITNDARQMLVAQRWFDDTGNEHFSFECTKNNHGPSGWEVPMNRLAHVNTWVEKVQPTENND